MPITMSELDRKFSGVIQVTFNLVIYDILNKLTLALVVLMIFVYKNDIIQSQ